MKNLLKISICVVLLFLSPCWPCCSLYAQASADGEAVLRMLALQERLDVAPKRQEVKQIIGEMAATGTVSAYKTIELCATHPRLRANANRLMKRMLKQHPELEGYTSLFNGSDLSGWKGLVENPIVRSRMSADELAAAQTKADEEMHRNWKVESGMIVYVGNGYDNLCTDRQYGDFELCLDWRLDPSGKEPDAGVYLRGTPQVQIWDTARTDVGAEVGSGGLYNNQKNPSKPLCVADRKTGEWNNFYIRMVGDRVTVRLNGVLVVDNVVLENYWDRSRPIFPREQIELQAHGSKVYYRNIYIKELE